LAKKSNNRRPNSAPGGPGLKISFKPAELGKTTDKAVALQVNVYSYLMRHIFRLLFFSLLLIHLI
jgi:hypothetical protein